MDERKRILLERYKKMIILATKDPDTEEAKTAARMAGELAAKHGLAVEGLDIDGHIKGGKVEEVEIPCFDDRNSVWEMRLAGTLQSVFDVEFVRDPNVSHPEAKYKHVIFGTKSDTEIATWYFKFIRLRISIQADNLGYNNGAARTEFGIGAVAAIWQRLREMKDVQEEFEAPETKALVLVKKDDITKAKHARYSRLKTARKVKVRHTGAFDKGFQTGQNMPLNTPINDK